MPGAAAVLAIALGGGAVGFGVVLPALETPAPSPTPRIALEPAPPDEGPLPDEINGVVVRADGSPVRGALVALHRYEPAAGASRVRQKRTDARGRFRFADVGVSPGDPYIATARFGGESFSSDVVRSPTSATTPLRIRVARPGATMRNLAVDVASIAVAGDERGAQALHVVTIRNRSPRAFTGDLRLPLLPQATSIDPGPGLDRLRLTLRGGDLVSTAPVLPGRTDMTYTYVAPMNARGITLRTKAQMDTKRFELLVGGKLAATTSDLRPGDDVALGSQDARRTYRSFVARNVERGTVISARILPAKPSALPRTAGLVAAALAALAIVGVPLARRRRARSPSPSPVEPAVAAETDRPA